MAITDNNVKWKVKKVAGTTFGSDGYWQPNETVKVGTVRFPQGSDNVGYILECIEAGTTGEEQPTLIGEELANYAEVGRVGQVRVIFNLAEKDVDEILAMGITYSRLTYPELWEWAGKRAGLIISEEEWQEKFAETNGKFVPYYSSGDGSSTFRTPLLGAYLKGSVDASEVGKWLDAGLPNITGSFDVRKFSDNGLVIRREIGAFDRLNNASPEGAMGEVGYTGNYSIPDTWTFNANKANSIYGNSDTVTPETMTGIWVIKAVGVVVDSGETDIAHVLTATEQVQERVSAVEDWTKNSANFSSMPSINAIKVNWDGFIEYTSDLQELFYDVPADGWICLAAYTCGSGIESYLGIAVTEPLTTDYDWSYLKNVLVYADTQRTLSTMLPVSKGYRIRAVVGNCMTPSLVFVYAQSEV